MRILQPQKTAGKGKMRVVKTIKQISFASIQNHLFTSIISSKINRLIIVFITTFLSFGFISNNKNFLTTQNNKTISPNQNSKSAKDIEMIYVEGGTFIMGYRNSHKVKLNSFYIGKYEVTQSIWTEIMGSNPSFFKGDNLPVEQVSWNEVQIFIKKLNKKTGKKYRLPTEAEWEYAASGGNKSKGYVHAGSNKLEEVAWYLSNSDKKTHPVGLKKPNELGIFDMSGNVGEFCSDWDSEGFYKNSFVNNPKGPSSGIQKVMRGGFWSAKRGNCVIQERARFLPDLIGSAVGFRLVLDK